MRVGMLDGFALHVGNITARAEIDLARWMGARV